MDYHRIYKELIERAKTRIVPEGYVEHHHIVPRCIGGTNEKSNIAVLTPEEHFMAHLLLVKMYPNEKGLICAVHRMTHGRRKELKIKHRKLYGWLKRRFSEMMRELQSGEGNSQFGMMWIHRNLENKRIRRGDPIPEGWEIGRKMKKRNWKNRHCETCGIEIYGQKKFCVEHSKEVKKRILEMAAKATSEVLSNSKFITNGKIDRRIPKTQSVPDGFWLGRTNGLTGLSKH